MVGAASARSAGVPAGSPGSVPAAVAAAVATLGTDAVRDLAGAHLVVEIREEHARECNYDVHVMFEQMRAETEQLKAEGWKVVPPPVAHESSALVREETPNP